MNQIFAVHYIGKRFYCNNPIRFYRKIGPAKSYITRRGDYKHEYQIVIYEPKLELKNEEKIQEMMDVLKLSKKEVIEMLVEKYYKENS